MRTQVSLFEQEHIAHSSNVTDTARQAVNLIYDEFVREYAHAEDLPDPYRFDGRFTDMKGEDVGEPTAPGTYLLYDYNYHEYVTGVLVIES